MPKRRPKETRMRAHDLGLYPFLLPLKLLGGLPYYRTDVHKRTCSSAVEGKGGRGGQPVPAFRKSKVWMAWSALIGLASLGYLCMGLWGVLQPRFPFSLKLLTVVLAGKINDLGDLIMLNLIVFYVIRNSPLLLRTLSSLLVLFQDVQISVGAFYKEPGIVVPGLLSLASPVLIVVAHVLHTDTSEVFLYLTTIYEMVVVTLMGLTLTFLNKWLTHLLVKMYEGLGAMMEDRSLLPPHSIPTEALKGPDRPWPSAPSAEGGVFVIDAETGDRDEPSVAPRLPPLTLDTVLKAQRKAAMVSEVHNLMNEYFGFPVALLILHSIFTLILACFYLSFLPFFSTWDLVVCVGYIIEPTFLVVILCDMPQKLEDQVSQMRSHSHSRSRSRSSSWNSLI